MKIIQLTDMHLFADKDARFAGIPTLQCLRDIITFVREKHADFDYIIITGDIAHDEKTETYQLLRDLIEDWIPRCRIIPGNHDNRDGIRSVFPEICASENSDFLNFSLHVSGLNLIGMDTQVPGKVHGIIDSNQSDWLLKQLSVNQGAPSFLFLHHHPVPVGSSWIDVIGLEQSDAFSKVISQEHLIKAIFTGHVHQDCSVKWNQLPVFGTPSTGIQFQPASDKAVFDHLPPGFRIIDINRDKFRTEVIRLPELKYLPRE